MPSPNRPVNRFVVNIWRHYIICSSGTRRSIRDYKVNETRGVTEGGNRALEKRGDETTLARDPVNLACIWLADPVAGKRLSLGTQTRLAYA